MQGVASSVENLTAIDSNYRLNVNEMPTSRVCNGLETLFVKHNVRLLCVIQFEEQDESAVDTALRSAKFYSEMDTASRNWLCWKQEGAGYILSIASHVHLSSANS